MRPIQHAQTLVAVMIALSTVGLPAHAAESTVQLGPHPFYLELPEIIVPPLGRAGDEWSSTTRDL